MRNCCESDETEDTGDYEDENSSDDGTESTEYSSTSSCDDSDSDFETEKYELSTNKRKISVKGLKRLKGSLSYVSEYETVNLRKRKGPTIRPLKNKTGKSDHVSTHIDLNVYFSASTVGRNSRHWPLRSGIREVLSNAIDSAISSIDTREFSGKVPEFQLANGNAGVSGHLLLNGKVACSYCVSIDPVIINPAYEGKITRGGYLPAKYIESENIKSNDQLYRVALLIRNIGACLPLEAWVNSYSTKGTEVDPIVRESTIGGFGYGLKDAVLCCFTNGFNLFEVFATDPLAGKTFYRGAIERTRWCHHSAPTLNMKMTFHGKLCSSNKNVPKIVRDLSAEEKELLPSTVISIGSVVAVADIEEKVKSLFDAMKCHAIFASNEKVEQINIPKFIATELGKVDASNPPKKKAKKSSSIPDPEPVEQDTDYSGTMEVNAPCVNNMDLREDPAATFFISLSVQSEPQAEVNIYTWPGLLLLNINEEEHSKVGIAVPEGSRFTTFTMRPPNSFRYNTQRDRAHKYGNDIARLMGSAIIACCKKERENIGDAFPILSKATSLAEIHQIMFKARNTCPFNMALLDTLLDGLKNTDTTCFNINIDALLCLGDIASEYISETMFSSFFPLEHHDENSIHLVSIAHKERQRFATVFGDYIGLEEIRTPLVVPRNIYSLFVGRNDKSYDMDENIRSLIIQLAMRHCPWDPVHRQFKYKLNEMLLAEESVNKSIVHVVEVNIDPSLLSYLEETTSSHLQLLRIPLTPEEAGQYYKLHRFREKFGRLINEALTTGRELHPVVDETVCDTTEGSGMRVDIIVFSSRTHTTVRNRLIKIIAQGNATLEAQLMTKLFNPDDISAEVERRVVYDYFDDDGDDDNDIVIGDSDGDNDIVIGNSNDNSDGDNDIVIGNSNDNSDGDNDIVIGNSNDNSDGDNDIVIGNSNDNSDGDNDIVIGNYSNDNSDGDNDIVIGNYSNDNNSDGDNSDSPLQRNAFTPTTTTTGSKSKWVETTASNMYTDSVNSPLSTTSNGDNLSNSMGDTDVSTSSIISPFHSEEEDNITLPFIQTVTNDIIKVIQKTTQSCCRDQVIAAVVNYMDTRMSD